MRHFIILAAFALLTGAAHATEATQNFDSTCGVENFRVSVTFTGTPGEQRYVLSSLPKVGDPVTLYKGNVGGRFQVTCLNSKKGIPLVVFRSSCRQAGCGEAMYGAVETTSLELVLRPRAGNASNEKALADLLGGSVPNLVGTPKYFCCRD